jgi:RimJ/RimL family protein N-acetyltransferase
VREAVLALRPLPAQEVFSSHAALTLPAAEADPDRTAFAVLAGSTPVGFGVLDRRGNLGELVDDVPAAVLLRAFYLDASAQGRGLGTAAAAAVPRLAGQLFPDSRLVVLTVNENNPAAVTAYARAGFVDTGARYLGGSAGPQHVLVAAVPRVTSSASPPRRRRTARR